MLALRFNTTEARLLFQGCRWLRLNGTRQLDLTHLRGFLVSRLSETQPVLAARVRNLSTEEMEMLYNELHDEQVRAESLVFG